MKGPRFWPSSLCIFVVANIFVAPLCFNVGYTEGFNSLLQLPRSGLNRTLPRFRRVFLIGDFHSAGDGLHDDTLALKTAWKAACSFPKRATIEIPAISNLLIYPIDLGGPCRSKVTLRISGTINAPEDPDAWAGLNPRKWIYFHGVNHLTVEGGGTINGMGQEWWARSCKINSTNPCRHAPTAVTFHKCKNLKVQDIMVIDSQQMHLAFTGCLRVAVSHLKVIAPPSSPNTDGIHISASKGVQVKDSIISTGDDCISIVSNTSRVWISDIVCGPGHGISIGSLGKSNTWSQVSKVVVEKAFISNTENGARIKTWQGGSGFATDITFKNLLMENVSNPIIVDQYYCDSKRPCANQTSAVKVANISFMRIQGTSATEEAIRFACSDSSPCEGLYLEDVHLESYTGGISQSFCWEAYGSSVGSLYPPSCFLDGESFIKQKVPYESATYTV